MRYQRLTLDRRANDELICRNYNAPAIRLGKLFLSTVFDSPETSLPCLEPTGYRRVCETHTLSCARAFALTNAGGAVFNISPNRLQHSTASGSFPSFTKLSSMSNSVRHRNRWSNASCITSAFNVFCASAECADNVLSNVGISPIFPELRT